jgi:hypothetical protein
MTRNILIQDEGTQTNLPVSRIMQVSDEDSQVSDRIANHRMVSKDDFIKNMMLQTDKLAPISQTRVPSRSPSPERRES